MLVRGLAVGNPLSQVVRSTPQRAPPPIPFERPARKPLGKSEYSVFKLRSVPADPNSQTYELNVPYFRSGTPEEWLLTKKAIMKVITGQNITAGPGRFTMARRILEGDALAAFNAAATEQTGETVATFVICLDAVTKHVFPERSLQEQLRYMRRYLRKPRELKIREFQARVSELNGYLKEFPSAEQDSGLDNDELKELLEFAIPASWQHYMRLQGFDPVKKTINEFIEFCERLEYAESVDTAAKGKNYNAASKTPRVHAISKRSENQIGRKSGADKSADTFSKRKKADAYCPYHDTSGHDISECKVMLAQAKKMRGTWEASREPRSSARPINKKPNFKPFPNRQEMQAFLRETVKEVMSEEASKTGKRKLQVEVEEADDNFNMENFNYERELEKSSFDGDYPMNEENVFEA